MRIYCCTSSSTESHQNMSTNFIIDGLMLPKNIERSVYFSSDSFYAVWLVYSRFF